MSNDWLTTESFEEIVHLWKANPARTYDSSESMESDVSFTERIDHMRIVAEN